MAFRGRPPSLKPDRDDKPEPAPGYPSCPKYLSKAARKTWAELKKAIAGTRIVTQADANILALYCTAFQRWRAAEKVLDEMPAVIKCESGAIIQNPALAIANRAMEQLIEYGTRLGLDPVSRERLHIKPLGKAKGVQSRDRNKSSLPPPAIAGIAGKVG